MQTGRKQTLKWVKEKKKPKKLKNDGKTRKLKVCKIQISFALFWEKKSLIIKFLVQRLSKCSSDSLNWTFYPIVFVFYLFAFFFVIFEISLLRFLLIWVRLFCEYFFSKCFLSFFLVLIRDLENFLKMLAFSNSLFLKYGHSQKPSF